jgi:hypothetical protein
VTVHRESVGRVDRTVRFTVACVCFVCLFRLRRELLTAIHRRLTHPSSIPSDVTSLRGATVLRHPLVMESWYRIFSRIKSYQLHAHVWPFYQLFKQQCDSAHVLGSLTHGRSIAPLILKLIVRSPSHGPDVAAAELAWMMRPDRTHRFMLTAACWKVILRAYADRIESTVDLERMRAFYRTVPPPFIRSCRELMEQVERKIEGHKHESVTRMNAPSMAVDTRMVVSDSLATNESTSAAAAAAVHPFVSSTRTSGLLNRLRQLPPLRSDDAEESRRANAESCDQVRET